MSDFVVLQAEQMEFKITGVHDSGGVLRAFLSLGCPKRCDIPLRSDGAKSKAWGWDGNGTAPTVNPSVSCSVCGFHKTLINGAWQ